MTNNKLIMTTDPIADMLIRIKNAYMARHKAVEIPHSNLKENLVRILKSEGFVKEIFVKDKNEHKTLIVTLKYLGDKPALSEVRRVSKPGRRVYVKKHAISRVLSGFGISVLSTQRGIMTGREARKRGVGGEILCEVW